MASIRHQGVFITGDRELVKLFNTLDEKVQKRIGRNAVRRGATVGARFARKMAPRKLKQGGANKNLIKRSIGARGEKKRKKNINSAKFGVAVGVALRKRKMTKKASRFIANKSPLAHLFVLGTAERKHPRTGTSGRIKPVEGADFLSRAATKARIPMQMRMRDVIKKDIEKEAELQRRINQARVDRETDAIMRAVQSDL